MRASTAGGRPSAAHPRTAHGATIAAQIVLPVVQPPLPVGHRVDAPAQPPQDNPGTGRAGTSHGSRIGQPTRPPDGRVGPPAKGTRHVAVRTAPTPPGPSHAGGQGPVADDRGRLLGECCRRRANDSPDGPCLPNKSGPDNREAGSHPHVNPGAPSRPSPLTRMAERQPRKPGAAPHPGIGAPRNTARCWLPCAADCQA